MSWLVFTYSLPSRENSSTRVSLWRRLKRIGAVSPKGSMFILPDRDDCLESFQWMAQEIQQSKGEAVEDMPNVPCQFLETLTLSRAFRSPLASFVASSLAQKCMKNSRG
jgi:hypothetical protein